MSRLLAGLVYFGCCVCHLVSKLDVTCWYACIAQLLFPRRPACVCGRKSCIMASVCAVDCYFNCSCSCSLFVCLAFLSLCPHFFCVQLLCVRGLYNNLFVFACVLVRVRVCEQVTVPKRKHKSDKPKSPESGCSSPEPDRQDSSGSESESSTLKSLLLGLLGHDYTFNWTILSYKLLWQMILLWASLWDQFFN